MLSPDLVPSSLSMESCASRRRLHLRVGVMQPVSARRAGRLAFMPCLDCGRISQGSRCPAHRSERKAIRNADRSIARAVVEAHPSCQCTGCGLHEGACLATEDLTAEHVVPLAAGGTNEGERRTLCRRCNSSKGAR
jgi:5-methylcytosine-specific restriction endonuclease McrA